MIALLAACGSPPAKVETAAPATRLVVVLVIDQWPEWAFEAKRPELRGAGFDRLLAEGEWHVGRHPSAATLTAPGHALIGTGEPSATSGIVSNEWFRRDAGRILKSVEAEDGSVSAKWLRVPGLGDSIAAAQTGAKAVAVSLKDRAAVLILGHAGTSIWYEPKTVDWASTTHPAWLDAWNRSHPIVFHLHDVWTPLDPLGIGALSKRHDYQIGEVGEKGFGITFPHDLAQTRRPAEAIFAAPIGNDLVLDTAIAAVHGEHLGTDATPDLLAISLSAHDYIAHGWGHESWESWDAVLRLDAHLATFLAELDRSVGVGRWAMVVTSDHGASRLPELTGGGRLRFVQIGILANKAAARVLGPGEWIADPKYPTLFLSNAARERPQRDVDAAIAAIVAALRTMPGIVRVERTADLAGNCDKRTGDDLALCLALDPERSGEVLYIPAAGWVLEDDDEAVATGHGTLHDYDQEVPLLVLAPGRVRHTAAIAPETARVPMASVAALVAGWLGVTPPNRLPR